MSVEKVMRLSLCKGLPKKISRKMFKSFSLRSKIKTKCLSKIQKSQLLVKYIKLYFFQGLLLVHVQQLAPLDQTTSSELAIV